MSAAMARAVVGVPEALDNRHDREKIGRMAWMVGRLESRAEAREAAGAIANLERAEAGALRWALRHFLQGDHANVDATIAAVCSAGAVTLDGGAP